MIFTSNTLILTDASGTPCGCRFEWTEARTGTERLFEWLARPFFTFGLVAGLVAIFAGLAGSDSFVPIIMVAAVLFGIGWGMLRISVHMPGKFNALEFYQDGRIWSSFHGDWKTRLQDIRNIEWEQQKPRKSDDDQPYTHGVRIIRRDGRIIRVAENIEPDHAIQLTVLLTEALEEWRYPQTTASINGKEMAVW